jgi:hypothetical protein
MGDGHEPTGADDILDLRIRVEQLEHELEIQKMLMLESGFLPGNIRDRRVARIDTVLRGDEPGPA